MSDKNNTKQIINYNSNNQVISVGPINMLSNPSMEATNADGQSADNWTNSISSDAGSIKQYTEDQTFKKYGQYDLDIKSAYLSGTSGDSYLYSTQQVRVTSGQSYTFSSFIRTNQLGGSSTPNPNAAKAFLNVEQLDINGNHISWHDTRPAGVSGTSGWTQHVLNVTAAANAAYFKVYLEVQHDPTHFGGDAYFDGVQLEPGSTATTFKGHSDFRYGTDGGYTAAWVTSPAGELTEYECNNYGTPSAVIVDPNGSKRAVTSLSWDAADHLRSITTPENNTYTYSYDALGNMTGSTDPLNRTTGFTNYYNRLQGVTQADGKTTQNSWDPVNLNKVSESDQEYNSSAYSYDSGNVIEESNQLGIADNRVLNSDLESSLVSNPSFARNSIAYKQDGTQVASNTPRYETGKFAQALTVEEGTTNYAPSDGNNDGVPDGWLYTWNRRGIQPALKETVTVAGVPGEVLHIRDTSAPAQSGGCQTVEGWTTLNENLTGKSLTFSFWLWGSWNGSDTSGFYINWYDSSSNFLRQDFQSMSTSSNPTRFTFTATAPTNAYKAYVGTYPVDHLDSGDSYDVYLGGFQIEKGSYATSFINYGSQRSGESVTIPTSLFTPTQGTVEAWVKPSSIHTGLASQYIQMIADIAETGNNGLVLGLGTDGKFFIQAGTGTGLIAAKSTTVASPNNWYHVAGKWDSTGVTIYINGAKQGFVSGSPAVVLASTPTIGRQSQAVQRWFDGLIDDIRVSSTSRTDAEVLAGYNSGQPLPVDQNTSYKMSLDGNLNKGFGNYQPQNWSFYTPSGSTNQVEYDSTALFGGSNVMHINPGSNSYAYQWSSEYINLTGVDTFALSADIKASPTGTSNTDGACINVYWYDTNKNQISAKRYFNVRNAPWQRYFVTVDPPASAVYAKVMAITYGPYDGYFDNIQFEKSKQIRGYNFIDNSSFEKQTPEPSKWSFAGGYASIQLDSDNYSGSYDAQINQPSSGTSYIESQSVLPVISGKSYTLTGFMKTGNITGGGGRFHVIVYNSSGVQVSEAATSYITTSDTNWTKYVVAFNATVNGTAKVRLESASVGMIKFDNIRFSQGDYTVSNQYDSNKNYIEHSTNQLGYTTDFTSNNYGRVETVTSPSGEAIQYSYDGQGRLRTVTDNAGGVTTYVLDANGNVLGVSLDSDGTYNATTFTYDAMNNLSSETDANNNTTEFNYDQNGRLTLKTNPNQTSVSVGYDSAGYLSQTELSNGPRYNYGYDRDGRRTSSTITTGGNLTDQFIYTYDAVNNITSYTEKDGTGTELGKVNGTQYSAVDRLLHFNLIFGNNNLPVDFEYSASGRATSVKVDNQNKTEFVYDDAGNLVSRTNPNNTRDIYTYNEANQIIGTQTFGVTNDGTTTTLLPKWANQYTYDSDGRLISVTNNQGNNETYTYNAGAEELNRLTQAAITVGSTNYTFNYAYDPAGNILSMSVPNGTTTTTKTFQYDADNQIINNTDFAYDDNGNLTNAKPNGIAYQYVYDSANRLITVKNGAGTVIASYTYDGDGRRITKTVSGVTTRYHYFQGQLMYETRSNDPANVIYALYVRSSQGGLQAVRLYNGSGYNYYYYHYNADGDIAAVTDSSGNVYRQYFYDPYGNVIKVLDGSGNTVDINNDANFNNAYTYRGYRYDTESGLYFLNARYYAAGIGRFLTKDAFKGFATDPGSLNRYAYCEGDPVNFTDPSGNIIIGGHYVDRLFPNENPFDDALGSDPAPPPPVPVPSSSGSSIGPSSGSGSTIRKKSTNPPSQDYTTVTVTVGEIVGITGAITVDKNGHLYASVGPSLGKSYTVASGSIVYGWLEHSTTETELEAFLGGDALNVSVGFIVGAAINFSGFLSNPPGTSLSRRSYEAGIYWPQAGAALMKTWELW